MCHQIILENGQVYERKGDQNPHRCLAKRDEKTKELLSCKEKVSIFFEAPGDIQLSNAPKIWGSFPDLMFV